MEAAKGRTAKTQDWWDPECLLRDLGAVCYGGGPHCNGIDAHCLNERVSARGQTFQLVNRFKFKVL